MEESRSKYLFKNTAIFTVGNLVTKLISFFIIPLYTNVLNTSEYGTVDLVATVSVVAVPILTLNVMEAVMRFNLDKNANHEKITKIGIIVLLGTMIASLTLIPLSNAFSALSGLGIYVYFYCVSSASCQIFLCDLRGKELPVQYTIGSVLNFFLIALLNVVFLLVFRWGIKGYLCAYIVSNSVVTLYAVIIGEGYKAIRAEIDKRKMAEMLKYSVFLIPNSFMWWIINSSDHLMVTSMLGVAENGIYAISYKIPTTIATLTGFFAQAWSYSAIREEGADDIALYTNNVFKSLMGVTIIAGLSIMTFIKPFLRIYVSADYFVAWKYTPFLTIGFVYLTLVTFMSTSYSVHKDSMGLFITGTFGAIVNIALNLILIPVLDVYGAAIATCFSYIATFIFMAIHIKKYMVYKIVTKEFVIGSFSLLCSAYLMFINALTGQIAQLIILAIIIFIFRKIWLPFVGDVLKKGTE